MPRLVHQGDVEAPKNEGPCERVVGSIPSGDEGIVRTTPRQWQDCVIASIVVEGVQPLPFGTHRPHDPGCPHWGAGPVNP